MTAIDVFTAASPIYRAAIRLPHKTGEAFQVIARPRVFWNVLGGVVVACCFWAPAVILITCGVRAVLHAVWRIG